MNDITPNDMDLQLATHRVCQALGEATEILRENPALLKTSEAIGCAEANGYDIFGMLCGYMQMIELRKQIIKEDAEEAKRQRRKK